MVMFDVSLRFYAGLNDFLSPQRRQVTSCHRVSGRTSIKGLIESLGVPHTEVDVILANGDSVHFGYQPQPDDRVSVFPVFQTIDLGSMPRVGPEPLAELRFVLDTHLGRLASYLRMLGFDTLYQNDFDDDTLASLSASERRILLTQDRGLLKRRVVTHGYYVRSAEPRRQLREIGRRFELWGAIAPFSRCPRCNGPLSPIDTADIVARLQPLTRRNYNEFRICDDCGQIYWKGSHFERMLTLIEQVLVDSEPK